MDSENKPRRVQRSGEPSLADQLCDQARQLLRQGQQQEAVATVTRAIEQDRDSAEAYQLRKDLLFPSQDWEALLADLSEIVRLRPKDPTSYTERAMAYVQLGQFERAILDCNKAAELDSTCADAYFHRGYALLRLGRVAEAEADRRRCLLLMADPEELEASDRTELIVTLLNRGDRSMELGHAEEAVQAYSAILLELPDHIEARALRGRAYAKLGRFEEATRDLLEAWRLKEEHDRTGRGYLVAVEGSKREQLWAAFPDGFRGKCDAITLAEDLVKDPAPLDEIRTRIGDFERTKIYRLEGEKIEVIDWVWSQEHKARPQRVVTLNNTGPDPSEG